MKFDRNFGKTSITLNEILWELWKDFENKMSKIWGIYFWERIPENLTKIEDIL